MMVFHDMTGKLKEVKDSDNEFLRNICSNAALRAVIGKY